MAAERIIRYLCHSFRQSYFCQLPASYKRTGRRIVAASPYRFPASRQFHCLQVCTVIKRSSLDTCHSVRDRHFRQSRAAIERIIIDLLQLLRQFHCLKSCTAAEHTALDLCHCFRYLHLCQPCTPAERIIFDLTQCLRHLCLRQPCTVAECITVDLLHAVWQDYTLDSLTLLECIASYCLLLSVKYNRCDKWAAAERIARYARHPFRYLYLCQFCTAFKWTAA